MNQFAGIDCPDNIYIDGILIYSRTCKYKFPNKLVTINIIWNRNIINCYKMFANISNIIEIDLSQFNTSLIKYMNYMFSNCKSLIFANISNIDISSIISWSALVTLIVHLLVLLKISYILQKLIFSLRNLFGLLLIIFSFSLNILLYELNFWWLFLCIILILFNLL